MISTFLDEATRDAMGQQSVLLCKKLGYFSAGTIEFLVDADKNFYFLEMNTRLQVEHAVTEIITNLDLVHQMIRIAKGYRLDLKQDDIKTTGWAIECRVYAENPYKNFGLPNIGRLYKYSEPKLKNVRCDSGIAEGSQISIYYDNMIAKIIARGRTRNDAINTTITALDSYVIRGVTHNIPLLRDILSENEFRKGNINTSYLQQTYPQGFTRRKLNRNDTNKLLTVAAAVYAIDFLRNQKYFNKKPIKHAQIEDLVIFYLENKINVQMIDDEAHFRVCFQEEVFRINKGINLAEMFLNATVNDESMLVQLFSKHPNGNLQIM